MECKFELEHIGITSQSPREAEHLAGLLSMLFNLAPRHG